MVFRRLTLSLLCLLGASTLHAFEIQRVIISSNNNPLYVDFWPLVAKLWNEMGIRPTLALIGNDECTVDETAGDVIRFAPIEGVPESFQAQVIRLFLPALYPEEVCLVSDIDMLPISKSYFVEGADECPETSFLVYRDKAYEKTNPERYPMCYVAAKGKLFASIFNVHTKEDFTPMFRSWHALGLNWDTDELMLYQKVKAWEESGGQVVRLGQHVRKRLDRGKWKPDIKRKKIPNYIDCHCPRPYSKHKKSIDRIVNTVTTSLRKKK